VLWIKLKGLRLSNLNKETTYLLTYCVGSSGSQLTDCSGICMDKDSVLMIVVQRSLCLCIVLVDSRSV